MTTLDAAAGDLERENADLRRQLKEAHEQLRATDEILEVINASPGDLAPVFDAILEKATQLCNASFGILWRFEGGMMVLGAAHDAPAAFLEAHSRPVVPSRESGPGLLIRGEPGFAIGNMLEFPPYLAGDPVAQAIVDLAGARSLITAPLNQHGTVLGMITVYRREIRPFTPEQHALLQSFAAQAVIAMENARLLTETREALEQQTATAEILQVINASPGDLVPVFDAMLEKAMHLCEAAFGELRVYDGEHFRTAAIRGVPPAFAEHSRQNAPPSPGPYSIGARVLAGERVIHILDMKDDEAYRSGDPNRVGLVDLGGARTGLVASLRADEAILGFITLYRQEVRPFSDKQIALLQNFAAQAVIAIENARLVGELRQRTEEVAELNRGLEARVADQVEELERIGKLKRFLPPQLAEMIVSQGDEGILESHRREIVVVFCDLRGYTAFSETAEPEEVLDFLREYHAMLGPLVGQFEGTLDHFSGDGIMVFFNDPLPCEDPAGRAVKMAMAMRAAAAGLTAAWRRRDRELGFGVGIAQGYATLGQIGFADRSGYTAIGTVCNLAARLCAEAQDGQILISRRVAIAVEGEVALQEIGTLSLKGLTQPVSVFNVAAVSPVVANDMPDAARPSSDRL